jgi:hypothetical protein
MQASLDGWVVRVILPVVFSDRVVIRIVAEFCKLVLAFRFHPSSTRSSPLWAQCHWSPVRSCIRCR